MRLLTGSVILAIILSFSSVAFAQDNVCFSVETAGKMVVELERSRIMAEVYNDLEVSNTELQTQVQLYEELLSTERAKSGVYEETIETYNKAFADQRRACEQAIEDAKPSFLKQLISNLGVLGLGILVGLLL